MLRTRLAVAGYLTAILWVNIYICREIFFVEHSGYMNSMHGFWMAMARLADGAWFQPSWWPYWDAGMPFEHTYAPGIPASMAALARVSGISAARAFHVIAGLVYCLGPLTLFFMAWRLSGAPGYSFAAALFYSLAAPTQLVVPDARFSWRLFLSPRRLELAFVWDEVPHLAALAVLPVCVLLLVLAWREGRVRWLVAAGLAMAAMVLANAFGGTMLVMAALPALFTFGRDHLRRNAVWLAVTGAAAYLAISPFLPPSLLAAIAANTALDPESTWTAASWLGLGVVLAGCVALYKITRRWVEDAFLQFVLLFAWIASSPPLLATYAGWRFLPQANRYKQ